MLDYEAKQLEETRKEKESEGYIFKVNSDGYQVWYKEEYLGGAGVMLPRQSKTRRTWEHIKADYRDYLRSAVRLSENHTKKGVK